jgi:hypothetical protein
MSDPTFPIFSRYIGIDDSGAETPSASLKGLRVYLAGRSASGHCIRAIDKRWRF